MGSGKKSKGVLQRVWLWYSRSKGNPLFYTYTCALGAKIIFPEDDSSQIEGRVISDLKDIKKLGVKDISTAGYIPEVLERYDYLKKRENVTDKGK